MTESQHSKLKLSSVCSYEAYNWLHRIVMKLQSTQRYPLQVKDYFYSTTSHRQYLSKFLESVLVKLINKHGGFAKKVETTGARIKTKTGKEIYVPVGHKVKGEPDVMAIIDGRTVYFEVKVGRDALSADQVKMIARLEQAGAKVYIIHNVCDILEILYAMRLVDK